ncbi:MAG: phosphoenolpyruvate synthase, partial [Candidatus Omnitrophica bacterium]|nr:phosphoenolpyruvate synthase [Candidatus Omnitrophota bacterium]
NRVEGDYPRMVALDDPLRRPYSERDDLKQFSQHEVDLIDIRQNAFKTVPFENLVMEKSYRHIERMAVKDYEAMRMMGERGLEDKEYWILTLDNIFSDDKLADSFKKMLKLLEENYHYPVEIEFTVNFTHAPVPPYGGTMRGAAKDNKFKINLLQCRPLQTRGVGQKVDMPDRLNKDDIFFESHGYFLGGNVAQAIRRIIYVDAKKYIELTQSDKYEIARIVGNLNIDIKDRKAIPTLLMGPGRWGTTTPSLGVTVKFAEINNITVLAEVAFPAGNLMPELSFGTHFFQDLVETDIFYVALFPEKKEVIFNREWFVKSKDLFTKLMPQYAKYKGIISVYDVENRNLKIMSDIVSQRVTCFSKEGR